MSFNNFVMQSLENASHLFLPWRIHEREQIILPNNTGGVPIVSSGGGFYGPAHAGFRRGLKELGIKTGPEVGCSIGCWEMYMEMNGFTEEKKVDAYVDQLSHPELEAVMQGLVVPVWKPSLAMMRKFAQLMPVIRDLPEAQGNTSVIAGLLQCMGLIDLGQFCVDFVVKNNILPWDDMYTYAFDLINWEPYIFEFKTADQGKPGEQKRMGKALAAASAVPGAVRPEFYIDETGKQRLLIDGGFWHDGKGGLFEEPAIVSQLLDFKGMRMLYPHDPKDIVIKSGMPGSLVFEPLSEKQVRERIEWGYDKTMKNERLNRLVREGKLPLIG